MALPLLIASGQGIIPFVLIGIPSVVAGLVCLVVALILRLKNKEAHKKRVRTLSIVGVLLLALFVISPALDPLVFWVSERVAPQK